MKQSFYPKKNTTHFFPENLQKAESKLSISQHSLSEYVSRVGVLEQEIILKNKQLALYSERVSLFLNILRKKLKF